MSILLIPLLRALGISGVLAYKIFTKKKQLIFRRLDILWFLPFILSVLFFVYASMAPEGSCGSAAPGPCFGYGILWGVVILPLTLIMTPIGLFVILKRKGKDRPNA